VPIQRDVLDGFLRHGHIKLGVFGFKPPKMNPFMLIAT